jgi:hypothetical protein
MRSALILGLLTTLAGCDPGVDSSPAMQACMAKARSYYQRIDAYPTFEDGRDAEAAAAEHCGRSSKAFDGA